MAVVPTAIYTFLYSNQCCKDKLYMVQNSCQNPIFTALNFLTSVGKIPALKMTLGIKKRASSSKSN